MFDDEVRKKPKGHELGMTLDAMSVDELSDRITLLRSEIERLEEAITARAKTRTAAEALFKI